MGRDLSHSPTGSPMIASANENRAAFPGTEQQAQEARHWLVASLGGRGHPAAFAIETIGAELITNAVRHTRSGSKGGEFRVTLSIGEIVRIGVYDQGSEENTPEARRPSLTATSGRGLNLVDAIADDWGSQATVDGLLMWAEVQP